MMFCVTSSSDINVSKRGPLTVETQSPLFSKYTQKENISSAPGSAPMLRAMVVLTNIFAFAYAYLTLKTSLKFDSSINSAILFANLIMYYSDILGYVSLTN